MKNFIFIFCLFAILRISSLKAAESENNNIIIKRDDETKIQSLDNKYCVFSQCTGKTLYWSHGYGSLIRYCDVTNDLLSDDFDEIEINLWSFVEQPKKLVIKLRNENQDVIESRDVLVDFFPQEFKFKLSNPTKVWVDISTSIDAATIGWDIVFLNSKVTTKDSDIMAHKCISFDRVSDVKIKGESTDDSNVQDIKDQKKVDEILIVSLVSLLLVSIGVVYYYVNFSRSLKIKHEQLEDNYFRLLESNNDFVPSNSAKVGIVTNEMVVL